MSTIVEFTLSYKGNLADANLVDMYDVSHALAGFQRSIALTTHFIINEEIINQASSIKGANVLALPPEEGSWKFTLIVVAGIISGLHAPNNTPLGHLIFSGYDYVVKQSIGVHVDYDKSLGRLYEENIDKEAGVPKIKEHQMDSLIEKCNTSIAKIHRPIFKTGSAATSVINGNWGKGSSMIGGPMNIETYQRIMDRSVKLEALPPRRYSKRIEKYTADMLVIGESEIIDGRISSYNSNTFKGHIYVPKKNQEIEFELSERCKVDTSIQLIVTSLSVNAVKDYENNQSTVFCRVFRNMSRSGHLRSCTIIEISDKPINQG